MRKRFVQYDGAVLDLEHVVLVSPLTQGNQGPFRLVVLTYGVQFPVGIMQADMIRSALLAYHGIEDESSAKRPVLV
jgi:hypothetical protein